MFQWLKTVLKFKPACTCVLSNLVGIHNVLLSRESSCPTHGDAALMNSGHCPDCKGTTFQFGPEGGVGRVVTCEGCGSMFLVEVLGDIDDDPVKIVYWDRIERPRMRSYQQRLF